MKKTIVLLALIIIILIGIFVWPTLYKYDRIGQNGILLIRINRITGEAEKLKNEGWVKMEPKDLFQEINP